jgi:uncharacterized protein (TIGR02285 family)
MKLFRLILLITFMVQSSALMAIETIKWYKSNSPPSFILNGPMKGKGSIDLLVKFYQERMPDYNHQNILSNLPRFIKMVKKGDSWCHPRLLKTEERQQYLYFSEPITLSLPNHLIVSKSNLTSFTFKQPIALEAIFQAAHLKGRLFRQRSYGEKIDPIIKRYKNSLNLKFVTQKEMNLFKMLLLGRIDYTINYPNTAEYIAYNLNASGRLTSLPIKEAKSIKQAYFGCAKSPWGRQVINRINAILLKKRNSQEYRDLVSEVWLDKNSSETIKKYYDQLMLEK